MTGGQNFSKRSSKKNNNGHPGKLPPSSGGRFGITLLLLIGSIFIVFMMLNKETNVYPSVSYTDFLSAVEQGQVSDVQITDQKIILGTMRSVNGSPVQQFNCVFGNKRGTHFRKTVQAEFINRCVQSFAFGFNRCIDICIYEANVYAKYAGYAIRKKPRAFVRQQ